MSLYEAVANGDGDQRIAWSEVPAGAVIRGLAPIGVRWLGVKAKDGSVLVARGCPLREWAPCEAPLNGVWATIIEDTGPIIKSGHTSILRAHPEQRR